ncbi:MAG: hypothetical protein H0A74_03475 [Candidatus Vesicomyosocius endoextente]|uniref:UvrD-like helicase C-terminal domain-containing protein n=1 Tax=Candidatus Vesicomyosocius endoextente TaxID=2738853 RepID=A0A853GCQ4_9GAMM|nr:hypothetical protein [Candidatus Vesicomyosocius endoextente]
MKAKFQTIYFSKGLEADVVIILRCNAENLGLLNHMEENTVLNLLLSKTDQFKNTEERRLFYVAMTLVKEMLYFIIYS